MGEQAESRGDLGQRSRHPLAMLLVGDQAAQAACLPGEAQGAAASRNHPSGCSPEKGAAPHSQVLNQDLRWLLANQLQLRGGCAECEMRWERSADKCDG